MQAIMEQCNVHPLTVPVAMPVFVNHEQGWELADGYEVLAHRSHGRVLIQPLVYTDPRMGRLGGFQANGDPYLVKAAGLIERVKRAGAA